jgi:uncharacterized damage-inducible protein DinB
MSIATTMLPEFDEEFGSTRRFLELVPDHKLAWKAHGKSMELGRLAWHLTDFPTWVKHTVAEDAVAFSAEEGTRMMNQWNGKTRNQMLARFDADLKVARAALASTPDEAWPRRWTLDWGGQIVIDSPRLAVYRKWAMSHQAHHRAQLGMYLRLNEIAIPGVYGPSADDIAANLYL